MNNYLKTENFEKKGKKHQNNKIYKKKNKETSRVGNTANRLFRSFFRVQF